jgi:hypothetical protein
MTNIREAAFMAAVTSAGSTLIGYFLFMLTIKLS